MMLQLGCYQLAQQSTAIWIMIIIKWTCFCCYSTIVLSLRKTCQMGDCIDCIEGQTSQHKHDRLYSIKKCITLVVIVLRHICHKSDCFNVRIEIGVSIEFRREFLLIDIGLGLLDDISISASISLLLFSPLLLLTLSVLSSLAARFFWLIIAKKEFDVALCRRFFPVPPVLVTLVMLPPKNEWLNRRLDHALFSTLRTCIGLHKIKFDFWLNLKGS